MSKFKFTLVTLILVYMVFPAEAQPLNQKLVDEAMQMPLIHNSSGPGINTELWTDAVIGKDKALYYLALTAYLNPKAQSSDGRSVAGRVAETIKYILSEDASGKSREPSCRGDLAGWKDIGQVFSILLAKKTPEIWSEFTANEINKLDWLMKAFAVTGNYHSNIRNWPKRCTYQTYEIGKTWNPNHNDGYIGVMIAVYYYFGGADAVNKILADFKYDTYINTFRKLHFYNIVETWTAAGTKNYPEGKDEAFMKALLENPSGTVQIDKGGGKVYGARMPFVFGAPPQATEEVPYEPVALYRAIGIWMFPHVVTNSSKSGAAYILNNGSSPMLGKKGMCREFQITDGFVPNVQERSDARYSWWGWMLHIPVISAMIAMDLWPDNGELAEIENLIYVGSEDLQYKLRIGYHSFSQGKETDHNEDQLTDQGYLFVTDLWNNYIKNQLKYVSPDLKME